MKFYLKPNIYYNIIIDIGSRENGHLLRSNADTTDWKGEGTMKYEVERGGAKLAVVTNHKGCRIKLEVKKELVPNWKGGSWCGWLTLWDPIIPPDERRMGGSAQSFFAATYMSLVESIWPIGWSINPRVRMFFIEGGYPTQYRLEVSEWQVGISLRREELQRVIHMIDDYFCLGLAGEELTVPPVPGPESTSN